MTISGAHTYLSSSEIMEWMTEHTGRLTDQMQGAMDISEKRADMNKGLADLKKQLEQSKGPNGCYGDRAKAINEFLAKYGNDPDFGEQLKKDLEPMATEYTNAQAWMDGHPGSDRMPDADIDGFLTTLQGDIDHLNKDDQLAMIQINDYSSRINQGQQLASNLVSAMNQTAMALVNNIK